MKKKIVFQLTEDQLKQMVWDAKNYGVAPTGEKDVTTAELNWAKRLAKDYFKGLEEQISCSL